MKTALSICLILFSINIYAQKSDAALILTYKQNNAWLAQLKELKKKAQIQAIQQRILADTAVYCDKVLKNGLGRSIEQVEEDKLKGCKPLIYIYFKEWPAIFTERNITVANAKTLNNLLSKKVVTEITVIDEARAIYGTNGSCGVINIVLSNEDTYHQLYALFNP